jgi:hypothetical protein
LDVVYGIDVRGGVLHRHPADEEERSGCGCEGCAKAQVGQAAHFRIEKLRSITRDKATSAPECESALK